MLTKNNKLILTLKLTALGLICSPGVHATPGAPPSGSITVINNLAAHQATNFPGLSAQPIKVVFKDLATVTAGTPITSTGGVICSTVATVAYGGVTSISWPQTGATSPSTAGKCSKITSIEITPLVNSYGIYPYGGSGSSPTPSIVDLSQLTTPFASVALQVADSATSTPLAAAVASATVIGWDAGVQPVFDANSGALSTSGSVGYKVMTGLRAERKAAAYGVK